MAPEAARERSDFEPLSERFARRPGSVPSEFVPPAEAHTCALFVKRRFDEADVVNAGETTGTLARARATLRQGYTLFMLDF